jgi:hypothetical protein
MLIMEFTRLARLGTVGVQKPIGVIVGRRFTAAFKCN